MTFITAIIVVFIITAIIVFLAGPYKYYRSNLNNYKKAPKITYKQFLEWSSVNPDKWHIYVTKNCWSKYIRYDGDKGHTELIWKTYIDYLLFYFHVTRKHKREIVNSRNISFNKVLDDMKKDMQNLSDR